MRKTITSSYILLVEDKVYLPLQKLLTNTLTTLFFFFLFPSYQLSHTFSPVTTFLLFFFFLFSLFPSLTIIFITTYYYIRKSEFWFTTIIIYEKRNLKFFKITIIFIYLKIIWNTYIFNVSSNYSLDWTFLHKYFPFF